VRIDSRLLADQAPRVSARRQAASRRSGRALLPHRLLPPPARHPWWGGGREARLVSTTGAVAGPRVAAPWRKGGGVHAASGWCARGRGAAPVRGRPGWGARRWLATRVPVATHSTTAARRRPSRGWRPNASGTESSGPSPSTWSALVTRARGPSATSEGGAGRGRSAGRSRVSNRSWRAPGRFLKGRAWSVDRRGKRAALTAASAKPG
jgi:hypothetical protein